MQHINIARRELPFRELTNEAEWPRLGTGNISSPSLSVFKATLFFSNPVGGTPGAHKPQLTIFNFQSPAALEDDRCVLKITPRPDGSYLIDYGYSDSLEHLMPKIGGDLGKQTPRYLINGRFFERLLRDAPHLLREAGLERQIFDGDLWLFKVAPVQAEFSDWLVLARDLVCSKQVVRLDDASLVNSPDCELIVRFVDPGRNEHLAELAKFIRDNLRAWIKIDQDEFNWFSDAPFASDASGEPIGYDQVLHAARVGLAAREQTTESLELLAAGHMNVVEGDRISTRKWLDMKYSKNPSYDG